MGPGHIGKQTRKQTIIHVSRPTASPCFIGPGQTREQGTLDYKQANKQYPCVHAHSLSMFYKTRTNKGTGHIGKQTNKQLAICASPQPLRVLIEQDKQGNRAF